MDNNRAIMAGIIAMIVAAPIIAVGMNNTALGIGFGPAIGIIVYLAFASLSAPPS